MVSVNAHLLPKVINYLSADRRAECSAHSRFFMRNLCVSLSANYIKLILKFNEPPFIYVLSIRV